MNIKWYATTKDNPWHERFVTGEEAQSSVAFDGQYYQEMEGFGGCFNELGQVALLKLREEKRKKLFELLFLPEADGLRFNFCRMPIGASDYATKWYSYNETPDDFEMKHFSIDNDRQYLLPYIKEAYQYNPEMKLFASPWSPPTWMKFPQAYNYGTLTWEEKYLKAYALYFAKFVKAYEAEGIHIHQIHVQNEPMSSQKFPSCIWTGEQFAEFIGKYLGPLFERENIDTEIWLGTLNGPETDSRFLYTRYNDYANLVLHDKDAYKYIKGISYQWAGKYAVAVTRESWPEKRLMQSENECGDGKNTWEYARYIFEMARTYLANGVGSYIYWNMVLLPEGESTWGWKQNSLITVYPESGDYTLNYEYYVMKHYSRFVRPGARRLGLKGHWVGTSVAFENPDGRIVVVTANPFKREMAVEFSFKDKRMNLVLEADSFNTIVMD